MSLTTRRSFIAPAALVSTDTTFACHKKGGHGTISLHQAIALSCDVFFYNVGNRLGIDRIAQYADLAGYGHKTGIDLAQ